MNKTYVEIYIISNLSIFNFKLGSEVKDMKSF